MKRVWYYKLRGRPRGPVSPETLQELAACGQLQPTDMISRDGTTNWIRAGNVKRLFGRPVRRVPPVMDRGPSEVYFGPAITTQADSK